MEFNIKDYTVIDLLPHDPPMVVVDELVSFQDDSAVGAVAINSESMFLNESGEVPSWVGIEYMAQTIGLYVGALAKKNKKPIKLGFLLGTRRYEASIPAFKKGVKYKIEAKVLVQKDGLGAFECIIFNDKMNEKLITAQINVFRPENIEEFLEHFKK
ncbi:MAG: 3-hydroxylacyl-ACP dehydratase [Spirochaetia bacterium]|nr:3-hydroxylacyl-ACP dehydratase [Spirochaetia bacterium]